MTRGLISRRSRNNVIIDMNTMLPGYVTVKDVAEKLGVSASRVRQLIQELRADGGDIGYLVAGTRMLTPSDVSKIEQKHLHKRHYSKNS